MDSYPSIEEFLKSTARWREKHKQVWYEVAFWGYGSINDGRGMWNYYIFADEQMFAPEDFVRLVMPTKSYEMAGSTHRGYDESSLPDFKMHGGSTAYEIITYWDRGKSREFRTIKIGCDYGHLWDREAGYDYSLSYVKHEATESVDALLKMFPNRNERCEYAGTWDVPSKFYTAKNGCRVHIDSKIELPGWQPAQAEACPINGSRR